MSENKITGIWVSNEGYVNPGTVCWEHNLDIGWLRQIYNALFSKLSNYAAIFMVFIQFKKWY